MPNIEVEVVGKYVEILPKKQLQNISGICPGDRVRIQAFPNKLVIHKILSMDEVLNLPIIARGTPEEIEKELDEEGNRL